VQHSSEGCDKLNGMPQSSEGCGKAKKAAENDGKLMM
jgi:hypothetical protein